jgi:hypothetical protein
MRASINSLSLQPRSGVPMLYAVVVSLGLAGCNEETFDDQLPGRNLPRRDHHLAQLRTGPR